MLLGEVGSFSLQSKSEFGFAFRSDVMSNDSFEYSWLCFDEDFFQQSFSVLLLLSIKLTRLVDLATIFQDGAEPLHLTATQAAEALRSRLFEMLNRC